MPPTSKTFNRSVFINCPFDEDYRQMMRAMVFTTMYLGFEPRLASEKKDTGQERITKIKQLIKSACFSIHDISRIEPLKTNDLPRFNMPFELGLDFGCREFGYGKLKNKTCLVLEKERYRYQKVLSDISGNDIEAHNNNPRLLVYKVRDWILGIVEHKIPGGEFIWQEFNIYLDFYSEGCKSIGQTKEEMTEMSIKEFKMWVQEWLDLKRIV